MKKENKALNIINDFKKIINQGNLNATDFIETIKNFSKYNFKKNEDIKLLKSIKQKDLYSLIIKMKNNDSLKIYEANIFENIICKIYNKNKENINLERFLKFTLRKHPYFIGRNKDLIRERIYDIDSTILVKNEIKIKEVYFKSFLNSPALQYINYSNDVDLGNNQEIKDFINIKKNEINKNSLTIKCLTALMKDIVCLTHKLNNTSNFLSNIDINKESSFLISFNGEKKMDISPESFKKYDSILNLCTNIMYIKNMILEYNKKVVNFNNYEDEWHNRFIDKIDKQEIITNDMIKLFKTTIIEFVLGNHFSLFSLLPLLEESIKRDESLINNNKDALIMYKNIFLQKGKGELEQFIKEKNLEHSELYSLNIKNEIFHGNIYKQEQINIYSCYVYLFIDKLFLL